MERSELPSIATAARPSRLGLVAYVRRRNGVPMGAPGSMHNMLSRSLGAPTFAGFWRYWNPIFSYLLGRFVYQPSKRWMPPAAAFVLTFLVCGAIHDLVTMLVRGSSAFLFTPWFLAMALAALGGEALGLNFSGKSWLARAAVNLGWVTVALLVTLSFRSAFGIA